MNFNKVIKLAPVALCLYGLCLPFTGCTDTETETEYITDTLTVTETVTDTLDLTTDYITPKYIFLFIGDGMANVQINTAEAALNSDDFLKSVGIGSINMQEFPITGMQTTHSEDRYITDSAAAATALATGSKTNCGVIAQDSNNENLQTMAEMAKEKGMKVGIISSVSIDHATPACFYAHSVTRNYYNYIADQMADSDFDFFAGGYAKGNFEKYKDSSRNPDDYTATDIEEVMTDAGYTITKNSSELDAAISNGSSKVWAYSDQYDGSAALPYEIDRADDDLSLADFTEKGIEFLENDNGFFMMVEGGKIDWACHANDAVASTMDVIAFDDAVGKAIAFYNEHPDSTLIIVTGDHETGGLTLGYNGTGYETAFTLLNYQTNSYDYYYSNVVKNWDVSSMTFETALASAKEYFGLGDATKTETSDQGNEFSLELSDYETARLQTAYDLTISVLSGESVTLEGYDADLYGDGSYDPFTVTVTHILNEKAGLDWTSYYHTGVPVPVLAMGAGQYVFTGYYDNTDVAKKIIEVGSLNE